MKHIRIKLMAVVVLFLATGMMLSSAPVAAQANWTFMVYLDGDNNLETAGIDDFLEMSSVGSTAKVNIIVQFDRIPGYNGEYGGWTSCKRFNITTGMTPTAANATEDIDEANMGDPDTLVDFINWTMANYPANNYALILWNHGSGWKYITRWAPWGDGKVSKADEEGEQSGEFFKGICWDDTNDTDYLTLQETEQALAEIYNDTGEIIDLLGYDACLMHMIEVTYQVSDYYNISVGSEEREPEDGWPYDTILTNLTETPSMTPSQLGSTIVSRYIESYALAEVTQSAANQTTLLSLVTATDNFADALNNALADYKANITQARSEVEDYYYPTYIDLYHFAQLIKSKVSDATVKNAAQQVMNEINNTVFAEEHGSGHPNSHGLTIYFPGSGGDYLSSYDATKFAEDTNWDEFLKSYNHTVVSCDESGNPRNTFAPGENVYVKAEGLEANTNYTIWIQDDPVSEGKTLNTSEDDSGAQETITTNASGSFGPELIWNISVGESVTHHKYDIVVNKQNDGGNTGKYNYASDGLDSATVAGIVAPIPELPTIVLFSFGLTILAGYIVLNRHNSKKS